METLYPSYNTPVYRSIPDLLQTDPEHLSFREKHRVRIFDQFEPITDADLYPVEQLPHVDRSCQTTPLPVIEQPPPPPAPPAIEKKRQATWTWPSTKPNETFRVIKGLRDAQAENTYGFAYYNELSHTELELNSPSTSSKAPRSRQNPRTAGTRLMPLEGAAGAQMEVTYARTNWEALMQHINDSIRDTNQQRMIGQYMIQKLKKEQTRANLPADQIELNKRCLEKLIQKYGTGLESIVAKEKEFERLIEAYQVFMRGDKKRHSKKRGEPKRQRKVKPHFKDGEEPLPAIGDLKAGRSQVGCKIRQDLRKEYGERLRKDKTKGAAKPARVQLVQQPGAAPRPMQVRVRRSVLSSNIKYEESDEELPPTPKSEVGDLVTESQLSVTYVPTEASLAGPEDEGEGLVVITQEDDEVEEEEVKTEEVKEESSDECLMLEGDSGSDVLLVDSSTELVQPETARTPNFTIEDSATVQEEAKEEAAVEEETEEAAVEEAVEEKTEDAAVEEETQEADVEENVKEDTTLEVVADVVAEEAVTAVEEDDIADEPVITETVKEAVVVEPVAEDTVEEEAPVVEAAEEDAVQEDVAEVVAVEEATAVADAAETSLASLDAGTE